MPATGGEPGSVPASGTGERGGAADGGARRAGLGRRRGAGGDGAGGAQWPPAQPALAARRAALRGGAGGDGRPRRSAGGCDARTGRRAHPRERGCAACAARARLAGQACASLALLALCLPLLPVLYLDDAAYHHVGGGTAPGRALLLYLLGLALAGALWGRARAAPGRRRRAHDRHRPGRASPGRPGAGGDA